MARKKKFVLENILITDYAAEGKCIARHQDKVIFVEGAVPGDHADIFVHKSRKDWAEARVNKITQPSPNRAEAFCTHFGVCGGCKWQMLPYPLQLSYKEKQVADQLKRIGKITPLTTLPILGCEEDRYYRNKLDFTFSNKQYITGKELKDGVPFEKNVLGFHAPGFFDKVIDVETCHLQEEPTNAIKNFVRKISVEQGFSYYDIKEHHGLLRNLMIRITTLGEVMVVVVFAENQPEAIQLLMSAIQQQFPHITSLQYIINQKMNDTIYDQALHLVSGKPFIQEGMEKFRFKISPKSFFQTNSKQATRLYQTIRSFANCKGHETLYDLYCGTGSIGIFLSDQVTKIIGVEAVADAIVDAKENALLNGVENTHFFSGDVIDICTNAFFHKHGKPDVVIIDPPRAGCHDKLIQMLLHIQSPVIVYVSCNPATQARDLQLLSASYQVTQSQAVDMFPHTHHIENVVRLDLISS